MRFDEHCRLRFRLPNESGDFESNSPWYSHGFFADVNDEGAVLVDNDPFLDAVEAYTVECRWAALPLPVLQDFIGTRRYLGSPSILTVDVRGRRLQVTSVTAGDERRRTLTLTVDAVAS